MRVRTLGLILGLVVATTVIAYAVISAISYTQIRGGEKVDEYREVVVNETVYLPLPKPVSGVDVEEAILLRRSIREYTDDPIPLEKLSMILWAAQGITDTRYLFRAAPSAGATYPLELYVVVGERGVVYGDGKYLEAGVYKYDHRRHVLNLVVKGDVREELARAALGQEWVRKAPVNIIICAVYERTTRVYGQRGYRYVHMEVGHVGQNIYLMAIALRLGTVAVGAFYDDEVARVVGAESDEHPLYIMPVGVPSWFPETTFDDIAELYTKLRG